MFRKLFLVVAVAFLVTFFSLNTYSQTKHWYYINDLFAGLYGAGDRLGYVAGIGAMKDFAKKQFLSIKFERGDFRSSDYDVLTLKQQITTGILGISLTAGHKLKTGRLSFLAPEAGVILRNHRWVVMTGNGFVEYGDRYVRPYSQAIWNDKTIGYTIALPFVWHWGGRFNGSLGPCFQNDTKGYSIFGGRLGLHIQL